MQRRRDPLRDDQGAATPQLPLSQPAPLPQAELDDVQRLACLRLVRSLGVGAVWYRKLINEHGGATAALAALPERTRRAGRQIVLCPVEKAEAELQAAAKIGAKLLFTIEPGYPAYLAKLEPPPPLLYALGDVRLLNRPSVAIVGSRDCSAGGVTMARQIAAGVGAAGFVVVSGLARGIDAAAHEAGLATGTVAVVAGGADVVYPPDNAGLRARIIQQGCIVSEMAPGFKARAEDFPRRNRIISGLATGVVIVEAARRSGTLITARFALEQNRDVFAVPGHPLDPRAEGTNALLKDGATLVTSADDVIATLAPQIEGFHAPGHAIEEPSAPLFAVPEPPAADPPADQAIASVAAALGPAPVSIDDVVRATGLPARLVQGAIFELTLAGRIERHGAQQVSLLPT